MNYHEWIKSVPQEISDDSLWKMVVYRFSLFAADIGWHDVSRLVKDRRTLDLSDQLYRSLGSIGANLAEGYSRNTGKDRARFYEYALGSARESRDWYYKARHVLGASVTTHRLRLLSEIVKLLLKMVPEQRARGVRVRSKKLMAPFFAHEAEAVYLGHRSGSGTDFLSIVPMCEE